MLEQTLQRNKEEAMLLAKARDIRARLVEQMQIMARSKHLKSTLSAWHHFCDKARKKRVCTHISSTAPRYVIASSYATHQFMFLHSTSVGFTIQVSESELRVTFQVSESKLRCKSYERSKGRYSISLRDHISPRNCVQYCTQNGVYIMST